MKNTRPLTDRSRPITKRYIYHKISTLQKTDRSPTAQTVSAFTAHDRSRIAHVKTLDNSKLTFP